MAGQRSHGWTRLALLSGALAMFSVACRDKAKGPPVGSGSASPLDSADQVIFGQRTLITDRGVARAEILADTSFMFDNNTRVEMRKVNGTFFNSAGVKDAIMESHEAMYLQAGVLEARGNVIITSLDGRRLTSPRVKFDNRVNQLSSDTSFVLTEPNGRDIRGIGFTSDPDMNNIHITRVLSAKAGAVLVPDK